MFSVLSFVCDPDLPSGASSHIFCWHLVKSLIKRQRETWWRPPPVTLGRPSWLHHSGTWEGGVCVWRWIKRRMGCQLYKPILKRGPPFGGSGQTCSAGWSLRPPKSHSRLEVVEQGRRVRGQGQKTLKFKGVKKSYNLCVFSKIFLISSVTYDWLAKRKTLK